VRVLILGPQGSGKGTQAKRLAEKRRIQHVATGDILRAAVAEGTDLGRRVGPILERGDLVPDELMVDLIRDQLVGISGFILDGFPRTLHQAEALDAMLGEIGKPLEAVVLLQVDDDVALERLLGRAVEEGRSDDTPDVIRNRLHLYHEQTEPIIERYRASGALVVVDGERPIDEVSIEIDDGLRRGQDGRS
jgi:adenylate kinase